MKLKLTCGGCRWSVILGTDIINLRDTNNSCPNCHRYYNNFYDSTISLHDESAISLDDVRAVMREELANARIVPME